MFGGDATGLRRGYQVVVTVRVDWAMIWGWKVTEGEMKN